MTAQATKGAVSAGVRRFPWLTSRSFNSSRRMRSTTRRTPTVTQSRLANCEPYPRKSYVDGIAIGGNADFKTGSPRAYVAHKCLPVLRWHDDPRPAASNAPLAHRLLPLRGRHQTLGCTVHPRCGRSTEYPTTAAVNRRARQGTILTGTSKRHNSTSHDAFSSTHC